MEEHGRKGGEFGEIGVLDWFVFPNLGEISQQRRQSGKSELVRHRLRHLRLVRSNDLLR